MTFKVTTGVFCWSESMCNPASDVPFLENFSREVAIGLYRLFGRHSKLPKHDRNQTTSTRTSNKVENITRSHSYLFTVCLLFDCVIDVSH